MTDEAYSIPLNFHRLIDMILLLSLLHTRRCHVEEDKGD